MKNSTEQLFPINRPFYFLCGPSIEYSKKRTILSRFLSTHSVDSSIRPYPFIVDEIFKPELVKQYGLNLSFLEEIVAAISYKTIIFLDSLSTSYELGSFKNSKNRNNVLILLEDDYQKRKRRKVGPYLLNSVDRKDILTYKSKKSRKEEYEFLNNKVPPNIKKYILDDISGYKDQVCNISITNIKNDENDNCFYVNFIEQKLEVLFSLKTLFYMLGVFLNNTYKNYKNIKPISDKELSSVMSKFENFILHCSLKTFGDTLDKISIYKDVEIKIDGYQQSSVNNIFKNIYFFFVLNNNRVSRIKKPIVEMLKDSKRYNIDFFDFISNIDKSIINQLKHYVQKPNNYVEKLSYIINKKRRVIYKYKDNYKGRQLRFYHAELLKILNRTLPSNDASYAYKSGLNTLKCVEKHIKSRSFLKLDIHHFFESIKYKEFYHLYCQQIQKNLDNNGLGWCSYKNIRSLKIIVKSLFYKYHLPLGFVTSPKTSDYYLYYLDEIMSKKKAITYTRYADDILISSLKLNSQLNRHKATICNSLSSTRSLTINNKKTILKKFKNDGDSIKFLGINLVYLNGENHIRISKKYIKDLVKETLKCKINEIDGNDCLFGKILYVKNISSESFNRYFKALRSTADGEKIARKVLLKLFDFHTLPLS